MFTGLSKKRTLLGLLLLALFAALAFALDSGFVSAFDMGISKAVLSLRSNALDRFMTAFTHFGDFWFYVVVLLPQLVFEKTRFTYGLPLSAAAIAGVVIRHFIKTGIARPRPALAVHLVTETSFSFPSGHAMSSLLFWGTLILTAEYYARNHGESLTPYRKARPAEHYIEERKKIRLLALCSALYCIAIGFSRIYAGVHWPSDIVGGWLLAGVMLCFY